MRRNAWIIYLSVVAAVTAAYLAGPLNSGPVFNAIGLGAVVAIVAGARMNAPARRAPWYLFALGQALFVAGDALAYNYTRIFGGELPFPSIADAFYLAVYPSLVCGVLLLIRDREQRRDRASLIDSLILTVGLAALSWTHLISPYTHDGSLSLATKLISIAYPVMDVLVLAVVVRLAVGPGRRGAAFMMLAAGMVALLITDAIYGWLLLHDGYDTGGLLDAGWVLFYALLGAAALHPSMRGLARPVPDADVRLTRRRLMLLAGASLVTPLVMVTRALLRDRIDSAVLAAAAAILFALVLVRMAGLVRRHEQAVRREAALRAASEDLVTATNREQIAATAIVAARSLAGRDVGARLYVRDRDDDLRAIAADDRTPAYASRLRLDGVGAARVRLADGHPVTLRGEAARAALGVPTLAWLAPLFVRDEMRGALAIMPGAPVEHATGEAFATLAAQVALALESAALTDDLVRRQSEARLGSLVRHASDVICIIGADAAPSYLSPSVERVLGRAPEQLVGRPLTTLVHDDDAPNALAFLARAAQAPADRPGRAEFRLLHADGGWRHVEALATNLLAEDSVAGIVLNLRDITERKRAEAALAASERQTRQILATAHEAFVAIDERGRITDWNSQAEALFGWSREEALGRELADTLVPEGQREAHRRGLGRFVAAGEGPVVGRLLEMMALHRDGREFPVELTISPMKTPGGYSFNAFLRDISERKRTQDELAAAHDRALEASRLKSEFVANMSHEIRTPLNGVIGMSHLLLDTDLSSEQREYAEAVRVSGGALMSVINDILDFSKIEAGKLELDRDVFEPHEIVEGVASMLATEAHERGIELIPWIDESVPDTLWGDGGRIRQVLTNLMTNGVKFTSEGHVVVRVGIAERDGDRVRIRFEIEDTGIGIDPAAAGRIFDSFSQADSSTTRKYGGTGLGLAISKQLVELMGGEIGVSSEPGHGSTFWFAVPLEAAQVETAAARPRPDFAGKRVLVADDNATNRTILSRQLSSWGMDCATAPDAEEALHALRAAAREGRPFALALLDFNMPGMDGIELTRAIRADDDLRSVRLLILSSSGPEHASARSAGADGLVIKPLHRDRLRNEISRVLTRRQGGAATSSATGGTRERPIADKRGKLAATDAHRVLVAEDNPVNQMVAVRLLKQRGCAVDVAVNGREAVALHGRGGYAAIFMDCQMPELDGYAATAEIRRREGRDRRTPIIAMTANAMKGDREKCLAAGMDDYLGKPVHPAALDDVIARFLAREEDRGAPQPAGNGASSRSPESPRAVVDGSVLDSVCQDDDAARVELVRMLVEESRRIISDLAAAAGAGDLEAARRAAHTLKGSSATVGATMLADAAARLEESARSGRKDRMSELQAEVETAFDLTATTLEEDIRQRTTHA